MIERQRLPSRRGSENFTFELGGLRFTATISRLADGRIAELFLNNHKAGNESDTNARDAAIILSFALQHGADADDIRRALCRDTAGRALSPIGAALDLLATNGCGADFKESAPQANLQRRQHAQRKLTERDDAAGRDAACPRKSMANPNASRHRRE